MHTKLIPDLPVAIFVPVEYQLHMPPNTGMRTVFAGELAMHKTAANVRDRI